jgi:putative PIG3 family NAD(P)H quinone oxidoreductase
MMRAIRVVEDQKLVWQEVDTPEPKSNEVQIKVHATAINRADLLQRQGMYPPPPGASDVMGLECAGEVIAVGDAVTNHKVGDSVCALLAGGGYAEVVTVDAGSALPVPKGLTMEQAAALPEVFATAWLNLYMEAGLRPGESVILHAGASGVGTAGIQLCKAFDNPVFVTVGSADKLSACIELGANAGSNRHEGSFVEPAQAFSPNGIDVILDPVGGAYLADNINLLGLGGRLVLIGLMGGAQTEINLAMMMIKRLRVVGSTLRARPLEEKAEVMYQLLDKVWPKIESGEIKPIVDTVFPIKQADEAHQLVASDKTIGKVILSVAQ